MTSPDSAKPEASVVSCWSTTAPSVPGWYWHRFTAGAGRREPKPIHLVEIGYDTKMGAYCRGDGGGVMPFIDCEEWAPIETPAIHDERERERDELRKALEAMLKAFSRFGKRDLDNAAFTDAADIARENARRALGAP